MVAKDILAQLRMSSLYIDSPLYTMMPQEDNKKMYLLVFQSAIQCSNLKSRNDL